MERDNKKIADLARRIAEISEGHTMPERITALAMVLSKTIQVSAKSHASAIRLAEHVRSSIVTDLQGGQ